jgi:hypothetical protein
MVILNETKIKYEHLDKLLEDKLIDIKFGNDVNVVVDLKEIFRKFFRPSILPEGSQGRNVIEEIAADVINVIGHYRNYLYKKGKYSTFYFLYSKSECSLMKAKHADYKKDYYYKYFNGLEEAEKVSIIKKVIEILEKIVPKIPNSNFIDTSKFDEYTVAKFLVQHSKSNEMNLILSNDEMMAQLLNKNTFMINLKGLETKLLDFKNAVSVISEKQTNLTSNMLPLLISIAGAKRYNLDNIDRIGFVKAVKMVEKLISSGKVIDAEYVDLPLKLEEMDEKDRTQALIKFHFDKVKRNYELISNSDLLYSNNTELTVMFTKPTNVYTWNYFLELNSKIFSTYPLNLEMLLKGETLK